ncbi:PilZ domain-containing protein [Ferrovibrio sp.]|uniref:PilZ domain-containing protein n=1 Tax=Ferrovibrio sp. TaxID=1917215 RepID=UPI003D283496
MASKAGKAKRGPAKGAQAANRRLFDRRDTAIAAKLDHGGVLHDGKVENLSLTGFLFNPALDIASETKVKLWLADRAKPLSATVVGSSPRGLHGRLHIATPRLAQLSVEVDDMALLLINAARPPALAAAPAPAPAKPKAKTKAKAKVKTKPKPAPKTKAKAKVKAKAQPKAKAKKPARR